MVDLIPSLATAGHQVRPLLHSEAADAFGRWCEVFLGQVRLQTGQFRYRGFHWHAFSYRLVEALAGKQALDQYGSMQPVPVFIIPESWTSGSGVRCSGTRLPDLALLRGDFYVFPESMQWTIAITHEHPDFGPYFTWQDWCRGAG